MQIVTPVDKSAQSNAELRMGYLWMIASVAALGGLLFGYDWVVIGGARPFYEAYFHLTTASSIGWANSCALLGCFAGSLSAGRLSDRLGRKNALLISAFLFTVSSLLTGWAQSFPSFILWRIIGGVAIGLASNVSPTYIAEISPASWRGRLVSLNQFSLVIGIVGAQVVNWRIAARVSSAGVVTSASWNAQFGWRWMFTAVAVPALLFLVLTPFIPESPRWLVKNDEEKKALRVLTSIGGHLYGDMELTSIRNSLASGVESGKIGALFSSPLRSLLLIGICLAVLQQWCGINIIFNYAAEIYRSAGYGISDVMFNIVITGAVNLVFTVIAMLLVDSLGRRRLMLFGCIGVGASHLLASLAYRAGWQGFWVLVLTLAAIAFYAVSLAPVTWVLITELFPNSVRATAVSISVAALWVSSFALTYTFPFFSEAFGTSRVFLLYGGICLLGLVFVYFCVPETKGQSLEQIEATELGKP
jgi:SP family xylose:H+ symportor-like MFS transporter